MPETTWGHLKPFRDINAAERRLVEALRSGKYAQATGLLKKNIRLDIEPKKGFCCLGVACEISGLGRFSDSDDFYTGDNEAASAFLPKSVKNQLGWADDHGTLCESFVEQGPHGIRSNLTSYNDTGYTFEQIASIIELGAVELDNRGSEENCGVPVKEGGPEAQTRAGASASE
jgi:hypothetical protein